MHLTEHQLYTYLSQEMPPPDRELAATHLNDCPNCQTAFQQIESRSARVASQLAHLDPTPEEISPTPRAYAALQQKLEHKEPNMYPFSGMFQRLFSPKYRPALTTGLVIALLAISLTVPSIRAAAVEFLGLFRVQQIEVVEFNPANLPQNLESSFENLDLILTDEVNVQEGGDPVEVASAEEASALAGFPVLLPQGLVGQTRLTVQPETTASITVDLALWQSLLDEIGRHDIQIPSELDGQTITFHAGKSVTLAAGTCLLAPEEFEKVPYSRRNCTLFVQTPSPTIDAPPTLPVNEIGQAALQVLGLTPEEAAQVSSKIDWATTLVLPVPIGSDYQEVNVQGVTGTLFLNRYDSGRSQYNLIWVKDSMVYGLSGPGGERNALDLANSIK